MRYLRKNTAVIVTVGPFFDKTDGVTLETALTITNEKITLTADTDDGNAPTLILDNVTGATSGTSNDLNYITNNDAALMQMELQASDVNRLGRMFLTITDAANHVPVFHEFMVVNATFYDSMFATSGGSVPDAVAGASGGLIINGSNSGAVTLSGLTTGALATSGVTITGAVTISNGLAITCSSANKVALQLTGAGTKSGLEVTGGASANGGIEVYNGASGLAGIYIAPQAGDGVIITPTAGHGLNIAAAGTSKHGIFTTGSSAGTADGLKAVAGAAGGVSIRGNITGNITGAVSGAVGSVAGNVDGNVSGSVASVVGTAAIADAVLDRDMSTGTDSGSTTVRTMRQALRFLRNKWSISAGTLTVCKEDDATSSWTAAVTTDATADPIISNDPAGP